MTRHISTPAFLAILLLALGCVEDQPTPPPPIAKPEKMTEEIIFEPAETNNMQVIEAAEIPAEETNRQVKDDFNQDGLQDIAVATVGNTSDSRVEIFLQRKPNPNDTSKERYVKAGTIHGTMEGRITGIAVKRTSKRTDLLILTKTPDGETDLVLYRNTGERFIRTD